jgi:hypothetical protein
MYSCSSLNIFFTVQKFVFTNTEGWHVEMDVEILLNPEREASLLKFINNNLLFKESFVL